MRNFLQNRNAYFEIVFNLWISIKVSKSLDCFCAKVYNQREFSGGCLPSQGGNYLYEKDKQNSQRSAGSCNAFQRNVDFTLRIRIHTILQTIADYSKERVAQKKLALPLAGLKAQAMQIRPTPRFSSTSLTRDLQMSSLTIVLKTLSILSTESASRSISTALTAYWAPLTV